MCIYYIIYKTTNIINGFEYIGQHTTKDIHDGYLGSGIRLKNSIKQYGKEAFKKEILYIFESFDAMNQKEIELVNEEYIKRSDTYNIVLGGNSGIGKNNKGKTPWNKGITGVVKHSEESKQKMSASAKKPKSSEHCKNISAGRKGKVDLSKEKNPFYGKKHSEESRKKMKDFWARKRAEKSALAGIT